MSCVHCADLRAKLEDARAEIAAWEAYDRDPVDVERLGRWKGVLPLSRSEIVLLQAFVDANGRVLSRARLTVLLRSSLAATNKEEACGKVLDVVLTRVRHFLTAAGHRGALTNLTRVGWILKPDAVAMVRDRVGETRKAAA